MTHKQSSTGLYFCLFSLTFFFVLLEISYFIQCNRAYFGDFTFVSGSLSIPLSILPGVLFFLLAQAAVHIAYVLSIGVMTQLLARLFNLAANKIASLGIMVWSLGIIVALTANQYFFPNSKFSELSGLLLPTQTSAQVVFIIASTIAGVGVVLAIYQLIRQIAAMKPYVGGMLLTALLGYFFVAFFPAHFEQKEIQARPNIIIIGLDSVRPDFLSFFGHQKTTPFLDHFLSRATVFNNAVTPLARTFPSWTSILTGQYPKQTGIRFNLATQRNLQLNHSLPRLLQEQGYYAVYATDETRFSNIDHQYGFDQVITPPMGLNDFLIGSFNDFPLSNLVVNTWMGKWLFPYSYANRAVYFTYQPNRFLDLITPALQKRPNQPLFLAVHFCLPHHPYLFASLPGKDLSAVQRYEASISRVDEQVRDFFTLLKRNHILDHALVILLSDHGEALELSGDRITQAALFHPAKQPIPHFYPPALEQEAVDQSAGHGTDVLSLTQYRTLLAFRVFGPSPLPVKMIPNTVSLLDIKPTVLQFLGLSPSQSTAGYSLMPLIKTSSRSPHPLQHIFLESDFTPMAIRTVFPETRAVVLEGIQLFTIDPLSTLLVVKDSMGDMIIHSKQYADIYGDWILALYPQNKDYRMPILINRQSGLWTNDMHSDFAKHSPAKQMLSALKAFYGREIN